MGDRPGLLLMPECISIPSPLGDDDDRSHFVLLSTTAVVAWVAAHRAITRWAIVRVQYDAHISVASETHAASASSLFADVSTGVAYCHVRRYTDAVRILFLNI
jgi:hypothetical protein